MSNPTSAHSHPSVVVLVFMQQRLDRYGPLAFPRDVLELSQVHPALPAGHRHLSRRRKTNEVGKMLQFDRSVQEPSPTAVAAATAANAIDIALVLLTLMLLYSSCRCCYFY